MCEEYRDISAVVLYKRVDGHIDIKGIRLCGLGVEL